MLLMLALKGWIYDGCLISSDLVITRKLAWGASKVLRFVIRDTVIKPVASGYSLEIKPATTSSHRALCTWVYPVGAHIHVNGALPRSVGIRGISVIASFRART